MLLAERAAKLADRAAKLARQREQQMPKQHCMMHVDPAGGGSRQTGQLGGLALSTSLKRSRP